MAMAVDGAPMSSVHNDRPVSAKGGVAAHHAVKSEQQGDSIKPQESSLGKFARLTGGIAPVIMLPFTMLGGACAYFGYKKATESVDIAKRSFILSEKSVGISRATHNAVSQMDGRQPVSALEESHARVTPRQHAQSKPHTFINPHESESFQPASSLQLTA